MPPKRIRSTPRKEVAPSMALRRLLELVDLQQSGKKRATAHATISLESAIYDAGMNVTRALEDAGILEHRAVLTGKFEDADAYAESLVKVDEAYAELWAMETIGQKLRIENVSFERQEVVDNYNENENGPMRSLEKRMDLRRDVTAIVATPEAAVHLVGIRAIAQGAKDLSGSEAASALRRRLSQVARTSEGPTTVKVLRKAPKS